MFVGTRSTFTAQKRASFFVVPGEQQEQSEQGVEFEAESDFWRYSSGKYREPVSPRNCSLPSFAPSEPHSPGRTVLSRCSRPTASVEDSFTQQLLSLRRSSVGIGWTVRDSHDLARKARASFRKVSVCGNPFERSSSQRGSPRRQLSSSCPSILEESEDEHPSAQERRVITSDKCLAGEHCDSCLEQSYTQAANQDLSRSGSLPLPDRPAPVAALARSNTLPASLLRPAPPPKSVREKNACQGPFCYSPKACSFATDQPAGPSRLQKRSSWREVQALHSLAVTGHRLRRCLAVGAQISAPQLRNLAIATQTTLASKRQLRLQRPATSPAAISHAAAGLAHDIEPAHPDLKNLFCSPRKAPLPPSEVRQSTCFEERSISEEPCVRHLQTMDQVPHSTLSAALLQRPRATASPSPPPFGFYDPTRRPASQQGVARPDAFQSTVDDDCMELLAPTSPVETRACSTPMQNAARPSIAVRQSGSTEDLGRSSSMDENMYSSCWRSSTLSSWQRQGHADSRPSTRDGDDMPGAKARKVLGISDWDEDDDDDMDDEEAYDHAPDQSLQARLTGAIHRRRLSLSNMPAISRSGKLSNMTGARRGDSVEVSTPRSTLLSIKAAAASIARPGSSQRASSPSPPSAMIQPRDPTLSKALRTLGYEPQPPQTPARHARISESHSSKQRLNHLTPSHSRRSSVANTVSSPTPWTPPPSWAVSTADTPAMRIARSSEPEIEQSQLKHSGVLASRLDAYIRKVTSQRITAKQQQSGSDRHLAPSPTPSAVSTRDLALWEQSLDKSQKDASWHTMIEHRPRPRRSSSSSSTCSSIFGSALRGSSPYMHDGSTSTKSSWDEETRRDELTPPYPFGSSIDRRGSMESLSDDSLEELVEGQTEASGMVCKPGMPRSKSFSEGRPVASLAAEKDLPLRPRGSSMADVSVEAFSRDHSAKASSHRRSRLPPQAPLLDRHLRALPVVPANTTARAEHIDASPCPSLTRSPSHSEEGMTSPQSREVETPSRPSIRTPKTPSSSPSPHAYPYFVSGGSPRSRSLGHLPAVSMLTDRAKHCSQPAHSISPARDTNGVATSGLCITFDVRGATQDPVSPSEYSPKASTEDHASEPRPSGSPSPIGPPVRNLSRSRRRHRPESLPFPQDEVEAESFLCLDNYHGRAGDDLTNRGRDWTSMPFHLETCAEGEEGLMQCSQQSSRRTNEFLTDVADADNDLLIILPPSSSFLPAPVRV